MPLLNPFPGAGSYMFANGDSAGYDPIDATPFYMGLGAGSITADPVTTAPTAADAIYPIVRAPIVITDAYLTIVRGGVAGTTETGSGAFLVDNTTATTVFSNTLQWNAVTQRYSATGLTIRIAAGSFFTFRITPPTWVTNPTVTFYALQVVYTSPVGGL